VVPVAPQEVLVSPSFVAVSLGASVVVHASGAASVGTRVAVLVSGVHLSPGLVVVLAVLWLANLGLMALSLVNLFTRPAEAVRFRRRWPWAIVIVVVNWLGPLLYLAVGRIDAPLPDDSGAGDVPAAERARRAVELLYGPPEAPR
jgi:hypothetical protein